VIAELDGGSENRREGEFLARFNEPETDADV
jgi:hypothetical protein